MEVNFWLRTEAGATGRNVNEFTKGGARFSSVRSHQCHHAAWLIFRILEH